MQPVQVRMARAALKLSVDDLAAKAGMSARDLQALEDGSSTDQTSTEGLSLFFASSGIELIDADGVRAQTHAAGEAVPVEELTTVNDGGEG